MNKVFQVICAVAVIATLGACGSNVQSNQFTINGTVNVLQHAVVCVVIDKGLCLLMISYKSLLNDLRLVIITDNKLCTAQVTDTFLPMKKHIFSSALLTLLSRHITRDTGVLSAGVPSVLILWPPYRCFS